MVIIFMSSTLFPLFGNAAHAGEKESITDSKISNSIFGSSNYSHILGIDNSTHNEPLVLATRIYGTVKYTDCDINGVEIEKLPLRFARVELFQYYLVPDDEICLKTTYTTDTGYFYFEFDPYDPAYENQYFVRVYSENQYAEVKDSSLYTHDSDIITIPAGGSGLQYPIAFSSYSDHQAWNILDSVTETAEWVKARTMTPENPDGCTRSKINVYFPEDPDGDPNSGKYYFDKAGTWNEECIDYGTNVGWSDYLIYHEYGHAIMGALYGTMPADDSTGGNFNREMSGDNALEQAWQEGWAGLFEYVIGGGSPGKWVTDNTKIRNPDIEYAFRTNGYGNTSLDYKDWWGSDTNSDGIIERDKTQGNNIGILYDLWDTSETNDYFFPVDSSYAPPYPSRPSYDDDNLALGFGPIWDVMANKKPFTVYKFWDGWFDPEIDSTYSARTTINSKHWIKSIYFNHGIDPGSSNIDSDYQLPQNAPAPNLYMDILTGGSSGAYSGTISLYTTHVWDQDLEDQEFLRCRFENYSDVNGNGITDDGRKWYTIPGSESTSSSYDRTAGWDTRTVPDGRYLLRAAVDDDMLETFSTNTLAVIIDNSKPISSVTQTSPYWRNTTPITISATASNGLSGVNNVKLYYRFSANNATWSSWSQFDSADTVAPYQWSFPWRYNCVNNVQGHYQFYTIATDNAGNAEAVKTIAEVKHGYDSTPSAAFDLTQPINGCVFSNSKPMLEWGASGDSLSGVAYYRVQIALTNAFSPCVIDKTIGASKTTFESTDYPASLVDDTNYFWKIVAFDKAGNFRVCSSVSRYFTVQIPDPSQPGKLGGYVKDVYTKGPIGNAYIEYTPVFIPVGDPGNGNSIFMSIGPGINPNVYTTVTREDGTWSMGVPVGEGTIKASASGYYSQSKSVVISGVGAQTVNFELTPITAGGGGDEGCLIAGTRISTPTGVIPIENLREGDVVLSYNLTTGAIEEDAIYDVYAHQGPEDYILINGCLGLTRNHLIYVGYEIKRADELRQGDILRTEDGNILMSSIDNIMIPTQVYNIEVRDNANFFAEGILVHNVIKVDFGCPFAYVWNGQDYVEENNILPLSTRAERADLDVDDYYLIQNDIQPFEDSYLIRIYEPALEQTQLDDIRLAIIDYDAPETMVAITPSGEVQTISNPQPPLTCIDDEGNDERGLTNGLNDGYWLKMEDNQALTVQFPSIEGAVNAKLVVRHKATMSMLPYDVPIDPRRIKCSIHVQTENMEGVWGDFATIPARMNWVLDCIDISQMIGTINAGGSIRMQITGTHLIDYIGLDIGSNIDFNIRYLDPIGAYDSFLPNPTDVCNLIAARDRQYATVSPKMGIDVMFPYVGQTSEFRRMAIISHGHYYTLPEIGISQPVTLDVAIPVGAEGVLSIVLEELTVNSESKTLQSSNIDVASYPAQSVQMVFDENPLKSYQFRAWVEDADAENTYSFTFSSYRGSQTIEKCLMEEEHAFSLDEILWNITGAKFNKMSSQYEILRASYIKFGLNEYYHYNVSDTAEYIWDFGDGLWGSSREPIYRWYQLGEYKLNVTVINVSEDNRFLYSSTIINVVNAPPVAIIGVSQAVELEVYVAGRRGNSLAINIYEDGILTQSADVLRIPGAPNTTSIDLDKYLGRAYQIELMYTATHAGENPVTLYFNSGDATQTFFYEFSTEWGLCQAVSISPFYLNDAVATNPAFHFNALGSYDIDGEIVSWEWDFGDGIAAQGMAVEHMYSAPGAYEVTLTVTDNDGSAAAKMVMVICMIPAAVQPYPSRFTPPL